MFAAIRQTLSARTTRPDAGRKSQRRARLDIEALEERAMLTAQPFVFTTVTETGDFGGTITTAQPVKLAPMMDSVVQGKLTNGADVDLFRVELKPGQIVTVDNDTVPLLRTGPAASRLSLSNSASPNTPLGVRTARFGQSIEYRVPPGESGTYYVKIAGNDPSSTQAASYSLHLRPIGLDDGRLDPSYLSKTGGGLSAWLDGDTLDVSGPVGHGFGIRGNWTPSVWYANGVPFATYTATGAVSLETPVGEVGLPLPAGSSVTLTTKPQQWGNDFGEVAALDWNAPPALADLETQLGMDDSLTRMLITPPVVQATKFGLGLGSDLALQNTGAPLNPAVPYLYVTINPLASSTLGSATQVFSVVLDPADPFVYVGSPQTGDYFPITALAASRQGLIPFTPADRPSQWAGSLRGHLYVQGQLDTTALTEIPSEIDGELVLNLDPNHTGRAFGGATPAQLLSLYFAPGALAAIDPQASHQVMTNFSAGINGAFNISPFAKFADGVPDAVNRFGDKHSLVQFILNREVPKVLTVGHATLVYDGPTESTYFRGGTTSPFDGTPLAPFLAPVEVDVDAGIKPGGAFYLDVKGPYQFAGLTGAGELKLENNWPTTVLRPGLRGLTIQTVPVSSITADLQFNYGIPYVIQATLDVHFMIGVDAAGHLTYAGSGTVSGDWYGPNHGWQVWDWEWQPIGDVGIGVNNDEMWFEANGQRYEFALPH